MIGIVVTLVNGGEEIGSMFVALCFFVVIGAIAYYTGFIDPLFDMIGRDVFALRQANVCNAKLRGTKNRLVQGDRDGSVGAD